MRLGPLAPVALALALALAGCESSQEKSHRLEQVALAKRAREAHASEAAANPLAKGRNRYAKVLASSVVKGAEATAAVVVLRNDSSRVLGAVPVALKLLSSSGASLYTNAEAGVPASLRLVPVVPPHGEVVWVDDQVQLSGTPARTSVALGEGERLSGPVPKIVLGAHTVSSEEGRTVASGTVRNASSITQHELVVTALARRAGKIVAAGRSVVSALAGGATTRYEVFLAGPTAGAQVSVQAIASAIR